MKVGVIGSGAVGRALGTGFAQRGHSVVLGSRSPTKKDLVAWSRGAGAAARPGTFAEAASHGDVLVLAVLGEAVDEVIRLAGPGNFDGKTVIDATNPLDFSKGRPPGLFVGTTDSLGEQIQRRLPRARIVKAFNTVPNGLMVDPRLPGPRADMLICGNDPEAKGTVATILRDFGWSGVLDVGGIDASRWIEALVPLWVRVGDAIGTYQYVFQPVRR